MRLETWRVHILRNFRRIETGKNAFNLAHVTSRQFASVVIFKQTFQPLVPEASNHTGHCMETSNGCQRNWLLLAALIRFVAWAVAFDTISVGIQRTLGKSAMECDKIDFSRHVIQRMFERSISPQNVRMAIEMGEVIAAYADDKPYPSKLLLWFSEEQPLHVVVARQDDGLHCYVVTVYVPKPSLWSDDFKTRRRS